MSLFYLIVIIAPHVKSRSLQERNVQENALIVDHHIKKSIYIYIYIYRGYYMAARRCKISLRVLKNISRVSAANE